MEGEDKWSLIRRKPISIPVLVPDKKLSIRARGCHGRNGVGLRPEEYPTGMHAN